MMGQYSINDGIDQLDENEREGLAQALCEDPETVREWLIEAGYLDPGTITEAKSKPESTLTESQEALLPVIERMGQPRSAEEVVEYVQAEAPEIVKQYASAKHRPWMSQQLNALVEAGLIGRYRKGRSVKYTPTVKEAIRRWALENSRFVDELELEEANRISKETDIPVSAVRKSLNELLN